MKITQTFSNSIENDESIVDDKISNTTTDNKDNNVEKSTLSKSDNSEVEILDEANKVSSKNNSTSKMDKKSSKNYSNSGRNKSKTTTYNDYYKHYYGGNYRSFSKKGEFKKKGFYEKEKDSKLYKSKKSFDDINESIKEKKSINNEDSNETPTKIDEPKANESEDKYKKLSWAQIAKPKIDNRECM